MAVTLHVVPGPVGGWSVKKGGATRALKHFATKSAALVYGRRVSAREGAELVIHEGDGTVQRKDSHRRTPLTALDPR